MWGILLLILLFLVYALDAALMFQGHGSLFPGHVSINVKCQCRADIMFSYTYLDVIDGEAINGVPLYHMYGQFGEFVSDRLLCPHIYIGDVMGGNVSSLTAQGIEVRGFL